MAKYIVKRILSMIPAILIIIFVVAKTIFKFRRPTWPKKRADAEKEAAKDAQ